MTQLTQTLVLLLFFAASLSGQRTITGYVVDGYGTPLIGASVFAKGTTAGTVTDTDGFFSFAIPDRAEIIIVSFSGFLSTEIEPPTDDQPLFITMGQDFIFKEAVVAPVAFWYGAEAMYNFVGNGSFDNFIGSAPIKIGQYHLNDAPRFEIFLVGNIANLVTPQSNELGENAAKLAQPGRGLSIGLTPVYTLKSFLIGNKPATLRTYLSTYFNYNVFRLDSSRITRTESSNLKFSQFGLNLGLELEGFYLEGDNKPSTVYFNVYRHQFDPDKYFLLEGAKESDITGIEAGFILALPGLPFGLKSSFNTSNRFTGFWSIGMVVSSR